MLADEAFGVGGVGRVEDLPSGEVQVGRLAEMDGFGGEVADAGVAMLGVVPSKEAVTERSGIFQAVEASWEIRSIFERLELGFGEGGVVGGVGAAVALGDAQVGQQPGDGLGGHGGPPVGVQGELAGGDVLLGRGVGDEAFGQGSLFAVCQQFRLGVGRMDQLPAAFTGLPLGGKQAVHGALGRQVDAFIQECGIDLGRSNVHKARSVEQHPQAGTRDSLPFRGGQGTGMGPRGGRGE